MRSILLLAVLFASPAAAQPIRQYAALAISPAGDRIAAIESSAEPNAPSAVHGVIIIRHGRTGAILARIDPCRTCAYAGLAYSPDGSTLAFLIGNAAAGTATLATASGGKSRVLATINGVAGTPRWSPDGRTVALLATVGAHKEVGATQPGAPLVGEIGEANDTQRIAVVSAGGGALRLVSPPGRYVYEYDWMPDGRGFVATSAPGNGDANWWVATLDAIDLTSGAVRRIAAPRLQIAQPRVSPDGRTVAFIGGLMSDFGSTGGDLWTVPFAGGEATDLTAGAPLSVTSILWPAAGLRAVTLAGKDAAIVAVDPATRARTTLWSRSASFSAGDAEAAFSADGRTIATVARDFEHGPALFAGAARALRPLTRDNNAYPAAVGARSLTWRSGGRDVQGWLLTPRNADPTKRAAMITIVHGGPSAAHVPNFVWQGTLAALIGAGYDVFLPNPRGSFGQGEAFTSANRRDFGGGDLDDILAGIDAAEKVAPIDEQRLGIMGGSYGGFMAMFAPTRTQRFKAALSGAGLSNWISYYGTNGIDQWMIPFFGASAYDDPAAYRAVSAVDHIKQHHTPTLLYAGERDVEVPNSQSFEMWHALKAMGVPTSLVIYPGEGHATRDPAHLADIRRRMLAWFADYLREQR